MTCRAPTSATTCVGTATGAQLSYDNEGRLSAWQNAPGSPSSTAAYLYSGEGNRVEQQVTQGGVTTTTIYVGQLEEVTTSGSTTATTNYYAAGGQPIALAVNGVLSYLVRNGLGSVTEALTTSGTVQASLLYAPYGGMRYGSGTMPTSYGFTGQRQEALTGLDYYIARYYDPTAGQFTSPDTILPGDGYEPWGLSRYAYVGGNPIGRTDPSGRNWLGDAWDTVTGFVSDTLDWNGLQNDLGVMFDKSASGVDKAKALIDFGFNIFMDATLLVDLPGMVKGAANIAKKGFSWVKGLFKRGAEDAAEGALAAEADGAKTLAKDSKEGAGTGGGGQGGAGGTGQGGEGKIVPKDLYRGGNASGPRLDNVRIGKDVFPNDQGLIGPSYLGPQGEPPGISTFESPKGAKNWWKLPGGTELPSGLSLINDHGDHWTLGPAWDMTEQTFKDLLQLTADFWSKHN